MASWRLRVAGYGRRISGNAKHGKKNLAFVQNYFQRLEQALGMRKQSKSALAAHLGVALSTISRWRDAMPRAETVQRTADWLSVDAKWLMTGESLKKPSDANVADAKSNGNPNYPLRVFRPDDGNSSLLREDPIGYDPADGGKVAELEKRIAVLEATVSAFVTAMQSAAGINRNGNPPP